LTQCYFNRSTGTSNAEIDKLPEIHIDESVLDIEEVDIVPVEDQPVPIAQKVETRKENEHLLQ